MDIEASKDRELEEGTWAMHELDLSPVEEDDPYFPPSSTKLSEDTSERRPDTLTRSSTLGLHGHSVVYYRMLSLELSST